MGDQYVVGLYTYLLGKVICAGAYITPKYMQTTTTAGNFQIFI